jgi:hypothetical protein
MAALREAMDGRRSNKQKVRLLEAIRDAATVRLERHPCDALPPAAIVEGKAYLDFLLSEFAEFLIPPTKPQS